MSDLIEFTLFSHRTRLVLGLHVKGGPTQVYLDELWRKAVDVWRKNPQLDIDAIFTVLLESTILHEILHRFGAEEESFILGLEMNEYG